MNDTSDPYTYIRGNIVRYTTQTIYGKIENGELDISKIKEEYGGLIRRLCDQAKIKVDEDGLKNCFVNLGEKFVTVSEDNIANVEGFILDNIQNMIQEKKW